MTAAHRRHDLSDRVGPRWEPHRPGGPGQVGRPAADHRRFLNAVLWILRTGAPWRDLPPASGDGKNTHRRFRRWRDRGMWAALWAAVRDAPDCAVLMIDASPIKVPPHAAGTQGGHPQRARTQGDCIPRCIGSRTRRGGPSGWD